ncbi:unnamed protein product [Meloidogyne enterolobii]|uniref:Uncharacterized protein n=1 Tax=Meloidogyne enterolobii TaxID=390850 RepID=A0ACB1AWR1_MELEN
MWGEILAIKREIFLSVIAEGYAMVLGILLIKSQGFGSGFKKFSRVGFRV